MCGHIIPLMQLQSIIRLIIVILIAFSNFKRYQFLGKSRSYPATGLIEIFCFFLIPSRLLMRWLHLRDIFIESHSFFEGCFWGFILTHYFILVVKANLSINPIHISKGILSEELNLLQVLYQFIILFISMLFCRRNFLLSLYVHFCEGNLLSQLPLPLSS